MINTGDVEDNEVATDAFMLVFDKNKNVTRVINLIATEKFDPKILAKQFKGSPMSKDDIYELISSLVPLAKERMDKIFETLLHDLKLDLAIPDNATKN